MNLQSRQPVSLQGVIGFILFTGVLVLLALYYIPRRSALSDEYNFHLPLAIQFYHTPVFKVITGEHYTSANTPLPYIVSAVLLKTFGLEPDIYKLRLINLSVYILTITLLFFGYLKRDIWMLIIIACNVYLLKSAVMFYMSDWGLLFFFIFLITTRYMNEFPSALNMSILILSGLFAIMSQQFYMVLPVALLIGTFKINNKQIILAPLPYVLVAVCTIILPALLFMQWGGMTHPNFTGYNPVEFAPTNITAVLAIAGFHLSPFILLKIAKERKVYWLCAVLAIIFGVFLTPQYDHYMYEGAISGVTFRFIDNVAMHSMIGVKILTSIFAYMGILTFQEVMAKKEKSLNTTIIRTAILLFFAVYLFTSHLGERHIIPMICLLYLTLLPRVINRKVLYIWAAAQFIIGVIYINHLFHDLTIY